MHGYMMQGYMFLFWAASIGRARHRRGNSSSNAMRHEAGRFLLLDRCSKACRGEGLGSEESAVDNLSHEMFGRRKETLIGGELARGVALITFRLTPGSARVAAHSGHGRK